MKFLDYTDVLEMDRNTWVSVSESVPPPGIEVLVYMPSKKEPIPGYIYHRVTALSTRIPYEGSTDYSWDNRYGGGNCHLASTITHWKPLPNGPDEPQ